MPELGSWDWERNSLGIAPGRKIRIFEAYIEAKEAMSTSDFPTYIAKIIRHVFQQRYTELEGSWPQYTAKQSVEDFEKYTWSRWGRFPDIPEKSFNGPYEELALKELPGGELQLREFGAAFSLTRQLIISDRLGEIAKFPTLFAEALARTQSKEAAVNQFQANPTMWDGNALFSANHANTGTTALTANETGAATLIAAETALEAQTDDEGYKVNINYGRDGYTLIIPRELRWIAAVLNGQEQVPNAGNTLNVPNLVRGRYTIVEEPFFTDANNWYMAADPTGPLAFLAYVTLQGAEQPFLGLKDPGVRAVLGGNDPYSFEFDEISYKLRHDFAYVPVEWKGVYGSIVA
jgi:hypothetical protein